jgi:pyruvate,water dikinase
MIGFRGASRYTHPAYEEAFALECAALKRVRDNGFTNMKLMVPFCRTLVEARKVINAMSENGLKRGENGLEIYMMCEIPNNGERYLMIIMMIMSHFTYAPCHSYSH